MTSCQNCGKLNSEDTNFCRFCGTKFTFQQPVPHNPYGHTSPRPYAWKTDEFQTQTEPRQTEHIRPPMPAPLAYQQVQPMAGAFSCQRCGGRHAPRYEKRISTTGWIVFAVLLVFFFPLFWIGLLIKEDVQVCPVCDFKSVKPQLYR